MLSEAGHWGCLFWASRQRLCCRPISEADFDWVTVADPGQQSLCVVAEVRTNAQTIAVLWRKRDGVVLSQDESPMAILSRGECPNPCLDRLLLFFSGLTSKKDLLSITSNVIVYILGTIKKTKITNAEGKGGEPTTLHPWESSYRLWKLP